jgi:hypothetical protein
MIGPETVIMATALALVLFSGVLGVAAWFIRH